VHELLEFAGHLRTTMMCAEAVWWRCHRALIADVLCVRVSRWCIYSTKRAQLCIPIHRRRVSFRAASVTCLQKVSRWRRSAS
jgi:uncharacterized protein (DUF488 family)